MGDHYEVGQAGSVGPRSVAVGQNFTQVWHKTSADVDLRELAAELSRLREAARGFTTGSPEDELALAEIATAENAAKADDGAKVLRHLARAGEWALAIAKTIGVPVAVRALEAAIAG
ncbi:hypothetical protein [Actinoplanes couchii]|nr:hypothetical protein [Actinoplanes couchii]MDR6317442.1 hypothetical protein [Actinoplanes couchii]